MRKWSSEDDWEPHHPQMAAGTRAYFKKRAATMQSDTVPSGCRSVFHPKTTLLKTAKTNSTMGGIGGTFFSPRALSPHLSIMRETEAIELIALRGDEFCGLCQSLATSGTFARPKTRIISAKRAFQAPKPHLPHRHLFGSPRHVFGPRAPKRALFSFPRENANLEHAR